MGTRPGAWGTLAVGLFDPSGGLLLGGGAELLGIQALGVGAAFVWVFPLSLGLFAVLRATIGLRVSAEEELRGLDVAEHGMEAYPGFAKELGREPAASGTIAPEAIPGVISAGAPATAEA